MSEIHQSAIIADGARIGRNVVIGAFSTVGPAVEIEDGAILHEHVVIEGNTRIGAGTQLHPFAVIGGPPQDTSYRGEATAVDIGSNCVIREHATVHRGTGAGRQLTSVGNDCMLMVGAHVAHDCDVGNHVILVNNVSLGGHVFVGDHAIFGGMAGAQQRSRIGPHAFVGALTIVVADVIPFATAIGSRAELGGLNLVGLKRRGFDRPTIHALRAAYQAIFYGTGTLSERVDTVAADYVDVPAVMTIVDFIRAGVDRPLCQPRE